MRGGKKSAITPSRLIPQELACFISLRPSFKEGGRPASLPRREGEDETGILLRKKKKNWQCLAFSSFRRKKKKGLSDSGEKKTSLECVDRRQTASGFFDRKRKALAQASIHLLGTKKNARGKRLGGGGGNFGQKKNPTVFIQLWEGEPPSFSSSGQKPCQKRGGRMDWLCRGSALRFFLLSPKGGKVLLFLDLQEKECFPESDEKTARRLFGEERVGVSSPTDGSPLPFGFVGRKMCRLARTEGKLLRKGNWRVLKVFLGRLLLRPGKNKSRSIYGGP